MNPITYAESIAIQTQGFNDIIDITDPVLEILKKSQKTQGIVNIFVTGSTAGVTTIEYEPGLIEDLNQALERLFPSTLEYAHNRGSDTGNGHAHIRASFIKPSLTVPFVDGQLKLGTWQQIVLVDFDNRPRRREIIVTVIGE